MELKIVIMAIFLGISLSAAMGFKIFVPLLIISILSKFSIIGLGENFAIFSSWTAIIILSTATIMEIATLFIPGLGDMFETLAIPLAVTAGTILTATLMGGHIDPLFKWTLGLIAGGLPAGTIKLGISSLRVGSIVTTGGIATPALAAGELVASLLLTALAIIAAPLAVILVIFIIYIMIRIILKFKNYLKKRKNEKKKVDVFH
jgi:hypothetical protein